MYAKVSGDSQCSRTLLMNVAHCDCDKIVQGLGFVKDVWKALSNMIKGRALYQSVIRRLPNLFRVSVHSQPFSSIVPQCPVSHCNAYELIRMEAMVWMTYNGMGTNMYRCVWFSHSIGIDNSLVSA